MEVVGIKEAVKNGIDFLKALYDGVSDILVEEVEMDEQQAYWFITFSYPTNRESANSPSSPLGSLSFLAPSRDRKYKTLKINSKTGAVVSMKIREFQG